MHTGANKGGWRKGGWAAGAWQTLKMVADDIDRVLFPRVCANCGCTLVGGERYLCMECEVAMPRTDFHLRPDENPLHHRLLGSLEPLPRGVPRLMVERAAALFFYIRGNPYTELIKRAKYHRQPEIDLYLARRYAAEILPSGFFEGIDAVMPVPMHWRKQMRRGYNQADYVARGVAEAAGLPVLHNLYARSPHDTQTRKSQTERTINVAGIFAVEHPDALSHRHILVVDDVITTGATLLSCCQALHYAAPTARISVLALAATYEG